MNKFKHTLIAMTFAVVAFAATSLGRAQHPQPKPQPDFKVTYKVSMKSGGGEMPASESTSMIKGARQRTEEHRGYFDSVNITQCDLKRTLQLNDKTRKYIATPMETGEAATTTPAPASRPATSEPSRRGGVVTYISSSKDTGERKEMFGFTARHVISSTRVESSPAARN